jgi:hypothetical protein
LPACTTDIVRISAVGREKYEEEVTLMRRIVLLATVAVLVLVSTPFVVSATGRTNRPRPSPRPRRANIPRGRS